VKSFIKILLMSPTSTSRRHFLRLSGLSLAAAPWIGSAPFVSDEVSFSPQPAGAQTLRIQDVIDLIISQIPGGGLENTVDTVKCGNPEDAVTGIVTTFLATIDVIRQAAAKGANFIITHEPTFYNHLDETGWLDEDPVYQYKRSLLDQHKIVVWRFHDYWHRYRPDGILHGFLDRMGWQSYLDPGRKNTCVIPAMPLEKLARLFRKKLDLDRCFLVGDPQLACSKVGLLPGAGGRQAQIALLRQDIDVLVVGEVSEWETAEYARDAAAAGLNKGLIVLGHAQSEEPGMAYAKDWLQPLVPDVPVYHIDARDPFQPAG
jgi:putative NIF3 family GTP cyclohydrolase 1 type 2